MRLVSVNLLVVSLILCVGASSTDTSLFGRRAAISTMLDSLEFEKQLGKRQGKALDALEQRCRLLRDSLDILRASATGASFSPQDTAAPAAASQSPVIAGKPSLPPLLKLLVPANLQERAAALMHPRTIFGWFVLLVSVIAVGSGLILLIGIAGMIRERMAHPRAKRRALPGPASSLLPATRHSSKPAPAAKLVTPKAPPPADPNAAALDLLSRLKEAKTVPSGPQKPSVPQPSAAPVPPPAADASDPLNALRMRMRGDEPAVAEPSVVPTTDPLPVAPEVPIRQRVIDAHGLGLTPAEIAKGLQLSLDQVTLILRVHGLHP